MDINGTIYISPKYTRDDYISLDLTLDSDQSSWERAIEIFRDRIYGRFFNAIDKLDIYEPEDGFAIMAIETLLVETMLQFRGGLKDTKGMSCQKYKEFLSKYFFDFKNNDLLAGRFYSDVRCGILHSGQTSGYTVLTIDDSPVEITDSETLRVSIPNFTRCLKEHFDFYCRMLQDPKYEIIRKNFVKKMNYICNR